MNIPGFTAETSLYKTNGHYQTSRPAFTSVTTAIRAFHPAAEVIEVFGCPPGSTMVGTPPDDWYCLPDPLTEPGSGGQSPGGDGGDTERYGAGPGNKKRRPKRDRKPAPKKPKRYYTAEKCTLEHLKTEAGQKCTEKLNQEMMNNVPVYMQHAPYCGDELSELLCCVRSQDGNQLICDVEQV